MNGASAILWGLISARMRFGVLATLIIPAIVLTAVCPLGFRPEPLSVLFASIAATIACFSLSSVSLLVARIAGVYVFALMSIATAPRLWPFGVVICAMIFWAEIGKASDFRNRLRITLHQGTIFTLCLIAVLLLFGLAIDWRWNEWQEIFLYHLQNSGGRSYPAVWNGLFLAWNKIVFLPAVVVGLVVCRCGWGPPRKAGAGHNQRGAGQPTASPLFQKGTLGRQSCGAAGSVAKTSRIIPSAISLSAFLAFRTGIGQTRPDVSSVLSAIAFAAFCSQLRSIL
jgi:hypothetical protein